MPQQQGTRLSVPARLSIPTYIVPKCNGILKQENIGLKTVVEELYCCNNMGGNGVRRKNVESLWGSGGRNPYVNENMSWKIIIKDKKKSNLLFHRDINNGCQQ